VLSVSGTAWAQSSELEDFDDIIVIGEDAPATTISTITAPNITVRAEPDTPETEPAILFADALIAYQQGDALSALLDATTAAEAGDARAQVLAGHILMRGEAGRINDSEAVRLFKLAAAQDDLDAMLALGELGVNARGGLSQSDALNYYRMAADLGDTQAMRALSTLAQGSSGSVATQWEQRAAASGDVEAMRRRGAALIDTDPQAALTQLKAAAAKGDAESAYAAALMLAENPDVRPDEALAAKLMKQAANAGLPAAMSGYGLLVYQGAGMPRDVTSAADWFKRAAEAGDAEGGFLWAFTLSKGEGVSQNYEEAYYWLLKTQDEADDYDTTRQQLRETLEANVAPAILAKARARAGM